MVHNKKVLMISSAYPPYNHISSLRTAKFAKYLLLNGWEPYVITKKRQDEFGLEEPEGVHVYRTDYNDALKLFRNNRFYNIYDATDESKIISKSSLLIRKIGAFWLKELFAFPDDENGWIDFAYAMAVDILKQVNIDVIYSTAPPYSSHVVASRLVKQYQLPWVADYRDLWYQNPLIHHTVLRSFIEKKFEKNIMKDSSGLVTVSEPLAKQLSKLHNKNVHVILNGFDEDDYSSFGPKVTEHFSITYTGHIYEGKSDLPSFFSAVSKLLKTGIIDEKSFKIRFFGTKKNRFYITQFIKMFGVEMVVEMNDKVVYEQSIVRQRESTVLLSFGTEDMQNQGIYSGKIFEYLGAKRPILAVTKQVVIKELLMETGAGIAAENEDEVYNVIKRWYDEYCEKSYLTYKGNERAIEKYSRARQTKQLASIFNSIM